MPGMQVITVDISQLSPSVAELLALLTNGDEIVITDEDKAVARLIPAIAEPAQRVAGLHEGQGWVSEDFDAPLPDESWLSAKHH
jgi:antitoxin (DNA-binding transcriptional repressor) of toxin-antitoxin stability system